MSSDKKFFLAVFAYFNVGLIVGILTYEPVNPRCSQMSTVERAAASCVDEEVGAAARGAIWPVYLLWRGWWEVLR